MQKTKVKSLGHTYLMETTTSTAFKGGLRILSREGVRTTRKLNNSALQKSPPPHNKNSYEINILLQKS